MTNTQNSNYKEIKALGFDVELKNGNSGFARAYLMKGGKRTGQFTSFCDNKQSIYKKNVAACRKGSHLNFALTELLEMIKPKKAS